jgi:lysyl-tRNA synthetase class 1
VLLGTTQGPRMGAFIKLYGIENVATLIERALAGEDLSRAA